MDIEPGMIASTWFSCLDPDNYVVGIFDTRDPAINAPGTDLNWAPVRYCGPGTGTNPGDPNAWTGDNLGQVFGITLDNASPPNIYVSATALPGPFPGCLNTLGALGGGGIYKLNGANGNIDPFAQLNSGDTAALGQIDHVTLSSGVEVVYVSNLDDGLLTALDVPGGGIIDTFDHGIIGGPLGGYLAVPDDGNELTPIGRRVWGLGVNEPENRLYYSVSMTNAVNTTAPGTETQIWSIEISPVDGSFLLDSPQLEVLVPAIQNNGNSFFQWPITDISFYCGTRMMLAQRCARVLSTSPTGTDWTASAHASRVLECTGSAGAWAMSSVDKFRIGATSFGGTNSTGGVDFDSEGNVWATGDALQFGPQVIYGSALMPSTGSAPVAPFMSNSYLVDNDCSPNSAADKYFVFDVECYRTTNACSGCSTENATILCGSATTGDEFTVTFDVVNNSGFDVTKLVIPGLVGGVTVSPNIIDLAVPLPDGDTLTGVQLFLNGGFAGDIVCIPVGLLAKDATGALFECCGTEVCVELPACCMDISEESITFDAATGDPQYTFTVTNLGGLAPTVAGHLFMSVISPPGVTISNEWHDLGTLMDGDQITLSTTISGAQPGAEICFQITMHDATLNECCGIVHCITIPGGDTEPCVLVEGCTLSEDFDGDGVPDVEIFWSPPIADCCLEMTVYLDGVEYMSVDPNAGSAQILSTIDNLSSMSGTWCLRCFDPAVGDFVEQGCCVIPFAPPPPEFLRGDANSDGAFDISDVIGSLGYLFQGHSVPCLVALDSNDDETVDIGDTIFSLEALFGGGPSPWPPYQQCGVDETSGNLGCEYFPACEGNDSGPQGG
jgi:hypothetical protein